LGNTDVQDQQHYFFVNTTEKLLLGPFPSSICTGKAAQQCGLACCLPFPPPFSSHTWGL